MMIGDLDDNESRGDDWIDQKRITNVCQSAWQGEADMEGGNIADPQVRIGQVCLQASGSGSLSQDDLA